MKDVTSHSSRTARTETRALFSHGTIWLTILLACLFGFLAFLPYDLNLMRPDLPSQLFAPFYLFQGIFPLLWSNVLALVYGLYTLPMVLSLLLSRQRWSARGWMLLCLLPLLVLLVLPPQMNRPVVVFLAGGIGSIALEMFPYFMAGMAATFITGEYVQSVSRGQRVWAFLMPGLIGSVVGNIAHILFFHSQPSSSPGYQYIVYDLLLLTPLLGMLGMLGGLTGGYLRLALARAFDPARSATGTPLNLTSTQTVEASLRSRLWSVGWRLLVALGVGAFAVTPLFFVVIWVSLTSYTLPAIILASGDRLTSISFTSILNTPAGLVGSAPILNSLQGAIPLLLLALCMLFSQQARREKSFWLSLGVGIFCTLLIIGGMVVLNWLFSFSLLLGLHAIGVARVLFETMAVATLTGFALGAPELAIDRGSRRWLLVALGLLVGLGSFFYLPTKLQPTTAERFPLPLALGCVLVLSIVGALWGGWLRTHAARWITCLR